MTRVVMVSAAWGRFGVTRIALAQRALLREQLAGSGLDCEAVIVADDENLELAQEFGFGTVEQDNTVLGRKFNDGIEFACAHLEADYVVLIGSDDWMHPDCFLRLPRNKTEMMLPTPEQPVVVGRPVPEMVVGQRITIVDLPTGRMRECIAQGPLGVIPWILPRELLEPSGFRPLPEHQVRGIDGALWRGLGVRPKVVMTDPHWLARVDFKSDVNLNSYEAISAAIGVGPERDAVELIEKYPKRVVKEVVAWQR